MCSLTHSSNSPPLSPALLQSNYFIDPLTHSLTHPLTHSLTHSLTQPVSNSLTQPSAAFPSPALLSRTPS